MTKGYEKHVQRQQALSLLGKDLARRAGRACELCGATGAGFATREIEPVPEPPELSHCLLLCTACNEQMERKGAPDAQYWRCLETSAWSELPVVQVTAVRLLKAIDAPWTDVLLEQLYLTPAAERWLD